ncbi:MAG: FmdB family zinc ribbon protein, partial [Dehalococcoidia bacterium]
PGMPRYDYRCSGCGLVYEKREGFDAPSLQECPECSAQARRVLTPPAIVFKGSGWYINDSRKGSASADGGSPSTASDTQSEAKPEAKSESKPDSKAEAKTETRSESKSDKSESTSPAKPAAAAAD